MMPRIRVVGCVLSVLMILAGTAASAGVCQDLLVVASLNLEDFGNGGKDCKADLLDDLANVIVAEGIDLLALQEVMPANPRCYGGAGDSAALGRPDLVHVNQLLVELGSDWKMLPFETLPEDTYGPRTEIYVFLYNTSVTYLQEKGRASELLEGEDRFKVRPPAFARFRSGQFDFYAVSYHAPCKNYSDPESVDPKDEIPKLAALWQRLLETCPEEKDVILLGDFNHPDPEELIGARAAGEILSLAKVPTTCAGNTLDAILIAKEHTGDNREFAGFAEAVDNTCLCRGDEQKPLSNHKMLLAYFNIGFDDD